MKNVTFIMLLLVGSFGAAWGQKSPSKDRDIQGNYLMEFSANGNRYGIQMEWNQSIFQNAHSSYELSIGACDLFFIKDERDIEGISGHTLSNILAPSLSNQFRFLKQKQLILTSSLYAGWGYRRTKANYSNAIYYIDRDYRSARHFLAFGALWKLGVQVQNKLQVQAVGNTDFSRLIDSYEPTLFERPGFMYGLGIVYSLN
jgi:hypothetical protein